ncbi:PREDICTED: intrastrand cross-link recognition protein-like [Cyphomyrmex costatus]|uniref:intrastrand cross-link recognition protein-like n=1 Tax=Cyphomyrmex costatus TaxID=456900 RepID=UPI0008522118|nr:PREDICTED: intrastrand cross-link recognition protein-like [Cyphomyrmex costatus]
MNDKTMLSAHEENALAQTMEQQRAQLERQRQQLEQERRELEQQRHELEQQRREWARQKTASGLQTRVEQQPSAKIQQRTTSRYS